MCYNQIPQVVLDLHIHIVTCACVHTPHTNAYILDKCKFQTHTKKVPVVLNMHKTHRLYVPNEALSTLHRFCLLVLCIL